MSASPFLRSLLGLAPALALLGARPCFAASPIQARLKYVVLPPARCPPEKLFRDRVAGLLDGLDPFVPTAAPLIVLELRRDGNRYGATVTQLDDKGNVLAAPDEVFAEDCTLVVRRAGLVVFPWLSAALQPPPPPKPVEVPVAAAPAPPKAPDPPSRSEIPPDDLPPPPPPTPPPKPAFAWRAGGALGVDVRPGTRAAFGLTADIGFKVSIFSLAARFHTVPSARSSAGGLNTTLLAGGLVGCLRFDGPFAAPLVLALCAIGEGGQVQAQGGAYTLGLASGFFAGGGGGISVELPLGKTLHISVAGDLLGVVQPGPPTATGSVKGLAGGAGAGAGVSF